MFQDFLNLTSIKDINSMEQKIEEFIERYI